jgi:K(+)-stimulated pyrophosphate-energized sodium pump
MNVSVRSNVRTAAAAQSGLQQGLTLAFRAGAITGMLVAGLALLAIAVFFYYLTSIAGEAANSRTVVTALTALALGASLVSIFARLGGGIFTKAADVGADLVGKVEAGIPEDDPRNPAVIADNVGDNVGDCAGMAADLFETYVVTIGATMIMTALLVKNAANLDALMAIPLLIGGVCIVTSIIGTYFVKLGSSNNIMGAMYKGFFVTALLSVPAIWFAMNHALGGDMEASTTYQAFGHDYAFTGRSLFYAGFVGLALTGLIIWITEYYTGTSYRPVKSIAKASVTGHGTNVIQGLAISMEATALPALAIVASMIITYKLAGRSASPMAPPPCSRSPAWSSRSMPMVRSRTTPAASPKWPGSTIRSAKRPTRSMPWATPPRRSPRATQSAPPVSPRWCCSPHTPPTCANSSRA